MQGISGPNKMNITIKPYPFGLPEHRKTCDPLVSYLYFCSYYLTTLLSFKPLNPLIHDDKTLRACDPSSTVKLFAPLLVLTAGTGGMMTAHSACELQNHWLYCPPIQVESSASRAIDKYSPAEHVANIRDVFGLNMSDLASLLGVTRPTAYAWLEGQEPKAEATKRIQQLSCTADEIKKMNLSRLDKLVHRPILDGRSLFDLLKSDEEPLTAIVALKSLAAKEAQIRREPKGSGKRLRSLGDVLGESSVAIYERS